jgi:hypothetical protein
MHMITAREAAAQGSTPAMFFSLARFVSDEDTKREARARGIELAAILGVDLGGRTMRRPARRQDKRRQEVRP